MKKKKIKYDVAKNGEEAVQKWRSGGFHLILVGTYVCLLLHTRLDACVYADGYSDASDGRHTGYQGDPEIGEI